MAESVICPDLMDKELRNAFRTILDRGTLATRILGALGKNPEEKRLKSVYHRLCDCLEKGELFLE